MQAARFSGSGVLICNLYSLTTNQAAIALFRLVNRYVAADLPMPGVFSRLPAPSEEVSRGSG
jgi:hypothetical protein